MFGTNVVFVVQILGFAAFLWLGLYALARGDRGRVAVLLGAAAVATSIFFLQAGHRSYFGNTPGLRAFIHLTWWANILPIALWLHLSLSLRHQVMRLPWGAATLWVVYGATLALSAFSMGTNLVVNYNHGGHYEVVTPGPLYAVYVAYVLVCAGCAVVNLSPLGAHIFPAPGQDQADRADRVMSSGHTDYTDSPAAAAVVAPPASATPPAREGEIGTRLLVTGAVLFLLGAAYLALRFLLRSDWPEVPPYVLLLAGLGAVGAAVAVQSALLLGRDVRRDFLYSFTVVAVLLLLYLLVAGALVGFGSVAHAVFVLALAALIVASHTLYDPGRNLLDKLFFTPVVREERAAAHAYVEALATPPAGPHPELATRKAFDDAVRRALTHLSDPTKLATTPLLNLQAVARGVDEQGVEDNRLARAAVLKEILLDLLDGLRPADGSGKVTGDAWRYYSGAGATVDRARNWSRCWSGCCRSTRTPSTSGSAAAPTPSRRPYASARRPRAARYPRQESKIAGRKSTARRWPGDAPVRAAPSRPLSTTYPLSTFDLRPSTFDFQLVVARYMLCHRA